MRQLLYMLVVMLLSMCCSCGGGSDVSINGAGESPTLADQVPPLPPFPPAGMTNAGDESVHGASAVVIREYTDADLNGTRSATMTGRDLSLEAAGLSWAVLSITMTGDQVPSMLHMQGASDGVWVAVSDYERETWRWIVSDATGDRHPHINSPGTIGPGGEFHIAVVCPDGNAADYQLSVELTDEIWNVLVWVAGDNAQAAEAVDALNRIEQVGSSAHLRLLAGYDIDPAEAAGVSGIDAAHYIYVTQDDDAAAIVTDGDSANMSFDRAGFDSSDPAQLLDFIEWSEDEFANWTHRMLVFYGEGDGWVSRTTSALGAKGASGILSDASDGNGLTNHAEIAAALDGRHFDVICFDASFAGQASVLHEYDQYGLADYYIGSEARLPGPFPYELWFADWTEQFPWPQVVLVTYGAAHYVDYWESIHDEESCMAAYDAQYIEPLADALAALAAEVTPKAAAESEPVIDAISVAYDPLNSTAARDLGDFLAGYRDNTADATVQGLIDDALLVYENLLYHFDQSINMEASGLAIFQPNEMELDQYSEDYRPLAFNQDTQWLEMLEATGVPSGDPYPVSLSWEPGDRIVATWDDAGADLKLILVDQGYMHEGWPGNPDEFDGIIEFSADNLTSGVAEEWARLLAAAPGGKYTAMLNYSLTGPLDLQVALELQDASNALKQDLGTITISPGSEHDVADLFYDDGTGVEWVPGDYLEISWPDVAADFDLELYDPNGEYGSPAFPDFLTGKVEFSEDSAISGSPREWAKLLLGGDYGQYTIEICYCYYDGTPGATIDVEVKLFTSGDLLKHDFGAVTFNGDDWENPPNDIKPAATLIYAEP